MQNAFEEVELHKRHLCSDDKRPQGSGECEPFAYQRKQRHHR